MRRRTIYKIIMIVLILILAFVCGVYTTATYMKQQLAEVVEEPTEVIKNIVEIETIETIKYRVVEATEEEQIEPLGTFVVTAYCPCSECCGEYANDRPIDENGNPIVYTSTGAIAIQGKTIAVDPAVIPYGTEIIIDGQTYTAQDCGGSIDGNRIDIYFSSHSEAEAFGVKNVEVYINA